MKRAAAGLALLTPLSLSLAQSGGSPSGAPTTSPVVPGSSRPDLLVIVMDDVGFLDVFTAYGSAVVRPGLPTLASCASQGRVFLDAYAAPTCAPSRRALHCGLQWTTGNGPACAPADSRTPLFAEPFLPERLPEYHAGLFGKWHLGGARAPNASWELAPAIQGYDFAAAWTPANLNACGGSGYQSWRRVEGTHATLESAYEPDVLRDSFLAHWPQCASPKLGVVCPSLAHAPFHWPGGGPPFSVPAAQFADMLERLDQDLGAMLLAVDLARTTVFLVSDNGTPPEVAPDPRRAKASCYERGVRVPLIALGANVTQGTTSELVWIGDLYATAIELGGGTLASGPYPIASQSLVPLLHGAPWSGRDHAIGGDLWAVPGVVGTRYLVTSTGWKLIQWDDDGDDHADREALYDLVNAGEAVNQLAAQPLLAASLRATLEAEALP